MKRFLTALFFVVLLLNSVSSVLAYSIESATSKPHYEHPQLKIIEDAGNNLAIGQGMTENLLHDTALFEEIDGLIYVTIRYNLMKSIEDVSLAVQKRGEEDFIQVNYETVNAGDDTLDYRFVVPSKDVIVRSEVFVKEMGRNVIFYMDFDNFVDGNTDFVPIGEDGIDSLKPTGEAHKIEIKAIDELEGKNSLGYDHGLLLKGSKELSSLVSSSGESEEQSDKVGSEKADKSVKADTQLGVVSSAVVNGFVMFIVLITFFFLVSALVLYILSKHVKELNETREEALYEED